MSADNLPPRPDQPLSAWPAVGTPPMPVESAGERPTATWTWWQALGMYVLAFFAGGFAALPVIWAVDEEGFAIIASSVVAALVTVAILVFWLAKVHPTWRRVMGLPPANWRAEILAGAGWGLVLYPAVVFVIGVVVTLLYRAISGHPVQAPEQIPEDLSTVGVGLTLLYGVVIAPIVEEFFFRGMLFGALRDRYGFGIGAVGSGVAFGLIHYIDGPLLDSLLLMTVMVFTGIGLAWIYQRRGSIVAPMVAHMTFNVIGLSLIYALR
jgi:uncharacterized protein